LPKFQTDLFAQHSHVDLWTSTPDCEKIITIKMKFSRKRVRFLVEIGAVCAAIACLVREQSDALTG